MSRRFGAVPTDETVHGLVGLYINPNATKIWEPDKSGDGWAIPGPFTGQVNGNPSSTSVPYDTDVAEQSICPFMVLHNTTKGKKVKITDVDTGAGTIAVEANSPDDADTWDDGDVLTTASQTNTGRTAGFADFEITDFLSGALVHGMFFQATLAGNNANDPATMIVHPYAAYSQAKETFNLKSVQSAAFAYSAGFGLVAVTWENGRAYFTMGIFFEDDQVNGLLTFIAEV